MEGARRNEAVQNQDQIKRSRGPSHWVEYRWWSLTCTGALCFHDPVCSGYGMAATMAFSLHILLILALHVVGCVFGGVFVDAGMRGRKSARTVGERSCPRRKDEQMR